MWRLARLERLTKESATVSIPGICEESFDVPRAETRAWDPSHSLYLEVCLISFHDYCAFLRRELEVKALVKAFQGFPLKGLCLCLGACSCWGFTSWRRFNLSESEGV